MDCKGRQTAFTCCDIRVIFFTNCLWYCSFFISFLYFSLLCSGMKLLNSSAEACRWDVTGQTSVTMTAVSQDLRLLITCMICWGPTTTLDLRWLATRLCSCSGSSSRPMSLKTSKDAMGQRTLKTMAICTGKSKSSCTVYFVLFPIQLSPVLLPLCVGFPHSLPWSLFQQDLCWETAVTCRDLSAGMTTKNCLSRKTLHPWSLLCWWERDKDVSLSPVCFDSWFSLSALSRMLWDLTSMNLG